MKKKKKTKKFVTSRPPLKTCRRKYFMLKDDYKERKLETQNKNDERWK